MEWFKNRTMYRYAILGFLGGVGLLLLGIWLEFNKEHLPYALEAFLSIQRTEPLIWVIDLAPFMLAIISGLLGLQYSLISVIARGKKEWETVFDSLSDPIFVVNGSRKIVRCNHAAI